MKKKILFPLMLLGCWLFFPQTTMAQYPPDYASAFFNLGMMHYHPVIRKVDANSALVSYYDDGLRKNVIALIDLGMNNKRVVLKDEHTVHDMRITGNNVYFCGTVNNGGKAFIGYVNLNDFYPPANRTVLYYYLDDYTSELNRLVAYDIGGKQKVVAVGKHHFITSGTFPCLYDPVTNPYNCIGYFIVEADFSFGLLVSSGIKYVPSNQYYEEYISEVIETPNYVALVGHYYGNNAPVIHRCDKSNVLNSFLNDLFFYYPAVPNEGHSDYHGCVMKGDTIAMASLSSYFDGMGMVQFSTNVRVFDLASMTNTEAQMVPLNTKSEPYDLVYMPDKGRLVLLQDICLPPHPCDQNMFMHLEPYAAAPYAAKCWYEIAGSRRFYSLDRLSDGYYLAAGGQYWCMKEVMSVTTNTCYKFDEVNVRPLGILPTYMASPTYSQQTPTLSQDQTPIFNDSNIRADCF